jgi:hypothetical protein
MPKRRIITKTLIKRVKQMSKAHPPNDIAKALGITPYNVHAIQRDPANNIRNPKRVYTDRKPRSKPQPRTDGMFDIDDYARNFIY